MKKYLISQFGRPHGLVGRLAGSIMAHRASNKLRNRWTVDLLNLEPSNQVLEVGSGPGIALAQVAGRLKSGQVVGLDYSKTMHDMAAKRYRQAFRDGRVILVIGSAEEIDQMTDKALDGPFDHIFGINVVMFWKDPVSTFKMLGQRLSSNGQLAFTFQPRVGSVSDEAALSGADQMVGNLRDAGFQNIRVERLESLSPMAVCVIARSY
jgi:SAM-dependent methyltransferase